MKRIGQILLALVVITSFASIASADRYTPRIDERRVEQRQRINQGMRSGQISRHEGRYLRMKARHIRRAQLHARADGRITYRERARLNHMQNRQGRQIYRMKHNGC